MKHRNGRNHNRWWFHCVGGFAGGGGACGIGVGASGASARRDPRPGRSAPAVGWTSFQRRSSAAPIFRRRDPSDGLHLSRAINHGPFEGRKPEVGLQPVPVRLLWGAADDDGGLPSHEGEKRPTGLDNLGFFVDDSALLLLPGRRALPSRGKLMSDDGDEGLPVVCQRRPPTSRERARA